MIASCSTLLCKDRTWAVDTASLLSFLPGRGGRSIDSHPTARSDDSGIANDAKAMKIPNKLLRIGRYVAVLVGLLYLGWTEVRVENLQALTDLAYDAPSCCAPGDTREQVHEAFRRRGYDVQVYARGTEMVRAKLLLGGWTFRSFGVLIDYGQDGKVKRCGLQSEIFSF